MFNIICRGRWRLFLKDILLGVPLSSFGAALLHAPASRAGLSGLRAMRYNR